ncbi:zinc ribbon domain-containing protein [bacterium]|nr:zinc ribbon domain-containing protein [bacterium]RQV93765.1 MAG: zinc ribbon domain-containing protein [bacterium]
MPTYEYQCKRCRHLFEIFQVISEKPVRKCPSCGGEVKRLIGPGSGLIFKGSGFYITDYKKKEAGTRKEIGSGSKKEGAESKKNGETKKGQTEKKSTNE